MSWFQVFIMGWYLGMLGWSTWALFASASPITLPVIALAAAVLAMPLRRLPPAMHARRSRRYPGKTGPEFTWRWIVTAILFAIERSDRPPVESARYGPSWSRATVGWGTGPGRFSFGKKDVAAVAVLLHYDQLGFAVASRLRFTHLADILAWGGEISYDQPMPNDPSRLGRLAAGEIQAHGYLP